MADSEWKEDKGLKHDLSKYVKENLKRGEILDFVKRDYPGYKWSLPTLDRRLRFFEINYIDYKTNLEDVSSAIAKELDGPGKLLGYRALTQKLRVEHDIKVPRHLVYNMLTTMDPEGVEARCVQKKKKKKKEKISFTCEGPLAVVSLDGHDKLCGYQNWTFPLGIYGAMDTFSRKILFIYVCYSNSNPVIIGKRYLEYLYEAQVIPKYLRIDRGTETGKMATLHVYLINNAGIMDDPVDSVIYGPSTSNKIERWWRDLHERLEFYFKVQLTQLIKENDYDPYNDLDRQLLSYVFIPVVQKECDKFVNIWNTHRIREQGNVFLPTGVPNHMFSFPESYGGQNLGIPITSDQLKEVAEVSGLLKVDVSSDNTSELVRKECERLIDDPLNLDPNQAKTAYLFLKENIPKS